MMNLNPPSAIRIGVFLAYLNDPFQQSLWQHLVAQAPKRNIRLIAFVGHGLGGSGNGEATQNVIYHLADCNCIDGLIVFSSTLAVFHGPTSIQDLLTHFRELPTVSIGLELPSIPSVCDTCVDALSQLVEHLYDVHGRRHFAMVTGPSEHGESILRESVISETLSRKGLSIIDALRYEGSFYRESGRAAARSLLDSGQTFDAVLCLNDEMAIGVLEVLQAQGVEVPGQVSIAGFDDIYEASWSNPPLSTIRQDLAAIAEHALNSLSQLIAKNVPDNAQIPGQLIVRQSCGCSDLNTADASQLRITLQAERAARLRRDERQGILNQHISNIPGLLNRNAIIEYCATHFKSLGIRRHTFVFFDSALSIPHVQLPNSVVSLCKGLNVGDVIERTFFERRDLLPGSLEQDSDNWIILALVYKDELFGYMAIVPEIDALPLCEPLRASLSMAIKAANLMETVSCHRDILEDQVRERTRDLLEISNRTMQSIGRDIHDSLCQELAGAALLLSSVSSVLENHGNVSPEKLHEIQAIIEKSGNRARQFARTLFPPGLVDHGLVAAVEELLQTAGSTAPGVRIGFDQEGDCSTLEKEVTLQLFRIIQEALHNALRHSGSPVIVVRIVQQHSNLLVEVRDFGRGLSRKSVGNEGMGLQIMRDRAQSIGATLNFQELMPGLCVSCILQKRNM